MSLTQGNRRRRGETSWIGWILRTLLGAAALGLLAASGARFLRGAMPLLGLFEHFSVQLGAAALLCLALMLLAGMRRWALLALALTAWHGAMLYPYLPLPWTASAKPVLAADAAPLKLLSLNLWYMSEQRQETIDYLLNSGADVIGTVETTAEWRRDLKALESVYPYHVDCVGTAFRCGVAIFSKMPFIDTFAGRLQGKLPTVVWVKLDWQGAPLTVAELQLINPLIGMEDDFQAEQGDNATAYLGALTGDLVVMGDFNSTPWSALQNRFRAGTGLDNRGRLTFTWPSWAPAALRLPIDQIFTRGAIAVRNVRSGPAAGSDHLPILGDLVRTVP